MIFKSNLLIGYHKKTIVVLVCCIQVSNEHNKTVK